MFGIRIFLALALAAAVTLAPAAAQRKPGAPTAAQTQKDDNAKKLEKEAEDKKLADEKRIAAEKKAEEDKKAEAARKASRYEGNFPTTVLAGGATNDLLVEEQYTHLHDFNATFEWVKEKDEDPRNCPKQEPSNVASIVSKNPDKDNATTKSNISVKIPQVRCWWPIVQTAKLKITATIDGSDGAKTLFDQDVQVSVRWFALVVTLLVLAGIYPGCAMVAYYLRKRRFDKDCADAKRKGLPPPHEPSFLGTLDPVQITANPHGRGSLSKLQIFVFSLLVFGLLLYYQLRYGILAGMSADVMLLMGISAVGAAGGKITYAKKRRISLDNWTWLRRKGWIPPTGDVQPRAKWSELFLDSETKEFDPYSFQMAAFSLVVAVALARSGLSGLGGFKIPPELLGLLGLSQVVFIGGKAIESSPYEELEKLLKTMHDHEANYLSLKDEKSDDKKNEAAAELKAFKSSVLQAAEMFWAVYGEQLPDKPNALNSAEVAKIEPGT